MTPIPVLLQSAGLQSGNMEVVCWELVWVSCWAYMSLPPPRPPFRPSHPPETRNLIEIWRRGIPPRKDQLCGD